MCVLIRTTQSPRDLVEFTLSVKPGAFYMIINMLWCRNCVEILAKLDAGIQPGYCALWNVSNNPTRGMSVA